MPTCSGLPSIVVGLFVFCSNSLTCSDGVATIALCGSLIEFDLMGLKTIITSSKMQAKTSPSLLTGLQTKLPLGQDN